MSEQDAVRLAYGSYEEIPIIDSALRSNFWREYDKALIKETSIKIKNIYKDVCSHMQFNRMVWSQEKLAYMITEPAREKAIMSSMLSLGWKRMREILEAQPEVNQKTGITDRALGKLQTEIVKYIDQRQHGTPIQRQQIEQKTMQINVDGGKAENLNKTPEEVDKELKQLEKEAKNPYLLEKPKEIIDVAVTMMEKVDKPPTLKDAKLPRITSPKDPDA